MSGGRLDRRQFLASVAGAAPVAALVGCAETQSRSGGPGVLDHEILVALAVAVLPAELGATRIAEIADAFVSWLAAYQPLAERPHGYGTDEIERLPPHPGTTWAAQLVALDTSARERFSHPFPSLEAARAADVVRSALVAEPIDPMPAPIDARHVAIALLAFFFQSTEATDLCYRATIGRYTCRPVAASPDRPPGAGLGGVAS